jgi:hypothetical protein
VRGKAAWCLVAAAVSLPAVRAQSPSGRSYREIVEEFRADPDSAIQHMLALPGDVIARGIDDAARVWPLQSRGAALVMHTDAALSLLGRDRSAASIDLERAQALGDALAVDPESAWLTHQWFRVMQAALGDDPRVKGLIEHWHTQPWYAAAAAMDRGLNLEARGSVFGAAGPTAAHEGDRYDPEAFKEAASLYKQAIAAHMEIAAVHLGRIEMLRGHDLEARRLFAQAAIDSHWRTTTYLADLFLGSMDERDDDWSSAERRYRVAVETIETAQSGRLALAALLGRLGRGEDAGRLLAVDTGAARPVPAFDPWWSYLYPYSDRGDSYRMILAELHVAVGR